MKLYHGRYILPALAVFLAVVTMPVWRGAVARGSGFQSPPNPEGQRCIEPKGVMRAGHMRLLVRWRDEVVRNDQRSYIASDGQVWEKSLVKTCLKCHGPVDGSGRSTSAATACDECHNYVNAKLDCWNCHLKPAPGREATLAGNVSARAAGLTEKR